MPENSKKSDFLLYTSPDGEVRVEVFFQDETIWLTQKRMAELFGVEAHTITYHLQEVFESKELAEEATTRKFRVVQQEGDRQVKREVNFYNLDAIISVGYRVNSHQATQFRIWATKTLRSYIIKGFAIDDEIDNSVVKKYLTTASNGRQYKANHYNLQAIISVLYILLRSMKRMTHPPISYEKSLESSYWRVGTFAYSLSNVRSAVNNSSLLVNLHEFVYFKNDTHQDGLR